MILFVILSIIILITLSLMFSTLSILGIGIIGLLALVYISKNENDKMFNSLSVIFIISIGLLLILYNGYIFEYGTPYYMGGSDDLAFENNANYMISRNYYFTEQLAKEPNFRFYSANGFVWIMSWIIRFSNMLGGYHTIAYRVLNIYFLIILGVLIFKYSKNKYGFSEKQSLIVMHFFVLFPNCQYISIHVFRDTLNILILFGIYYLWDNQMRIRRKNKISINILITIILTYISYVIRNQNIIFIATIIILNLILKDKKMTIKNFSYFLIAIVTMLVIFKYLNVQEKLEYFNRYYNEYILDSNKGLSQLIFSVNLFPFGIIIRAMYGLVSPLPIHILQFYKMFQNVNIFFQVLISLGVIVQIYFLPYLLKNIKCIDKLTLIFTIMFIAMISTTFTFRHFISVYPFMVLLMFRQFFCVSQKMKIVSFISITTILSLGAGIYLIIK